MSSSGVRRARTGLALSELLLVIVTLTVVLGLVVSLARRVRRESAHALASRVLAELDQTLAGYRQREARLPEIPSLLPADDEWAPFAARPTEAALAARVLENNRRAVTSLRPGSVDDAGSPAAALGSLLYDGQTLRDPWGTPIAFMASGSPLIGTAPGDGPFFFSAGPDGRFLTRDDNLYSYETASTEAEPAAGRAGGVSLAPSPAGAGGGEQVDNL